jgi:hypothetical protein
MDHHKKAKPDKRQPVRPLLRKLGANRADLVTRNPYKETNHVQ